MAPRISERTQLTESDKVIFLDVDGVLHNAYEGDTIFDEKCMLLLKDLVEKTRAKIVLSSSWREYPDTRNEVKLALAKYGMELYDQTHVSMANSRPEEIEVWLSINAPNSKFVILDDWDMTKSFPENMVVTQSPGRSGLIQDDIDKALEILKN